MGVFSIVLIVLAILIVFYFLFQYSQTRSKSNLLKVQQLKEKKLIEEENQRKMIAELKEQNEGKRILEIEAVAEKRRKNEERIRLDELVDETFIVVHKTYNHVNRPTIIIKRSNNMYAYTQHPGKIEDIPEVIQIDKEVKKNLIWFEDDVYQRQAKGGVKDDQIEY